MGLGLGILTCAGEERPALTGRARAGLESGKPAHVGETLLGVPPGVFEVSYFILAARGDAYPVIPVISHMDGEGSPCVQPVPGLPAGVVVVDKVGLREQSEACNEGQRHQRISPGALSPSSGVSDHVENRNREEDQRVAVKYVPDKPRRHCEQGYTNQIDPDHGVLGCPAPKPGQPIYKAVGYGAHHEFAQQSDEQGEAIPHLRGPELCLLVFKEIYAPCADYVAESYKGLYTVRDPN